MRDFASFVANFMLLQYGARGLVAERLGQCVTRAWLPPQLLCSHETHSLSHTRARMGRLLLAIEERTRTDKYVQLFGQFCGCIRPKLPIGAAAFMLDSLKEAFGSNFPLVSFTVRTPAPPSPSEAAPLEIPS